MLRNSDIKRGFVRRISEDWDRLFSFSESNHQFFPPTPFDEYEILESNVNNCSDEYYGALIGIFGLCSSSLPNVLIYLEDNYIIIVYYMIR